ncbi:MAG TPA: hypothetical protein VF179_07295 [Thermoanaerobaculia bacterium]|nr:hypothetical protein [Thermoanaerobaculia bacterium]
MKKTSSSSDELRPEYRFDCKKAQPNRFADPEVLDDDVAKVFTNAEAVNRALRALLDAVPTKAPRSG